MCPVRGISAVMTCLHCKVPNRVSSVCNFVAHRLSLEMYRQSDDTAICPQSAGAHCAANMGSKGGTMPLYREGGVSNSVRRWAGANGGASLRSSRVTSAACHASATVTRRPVKPRPHSAYLPYPLQPDLKSSASAGHGRFQSDAERSSAYVTRCHASTIATRRSAIPTSSPCQAAA